MDLDFSRCRKVWVPDESEAGGFWSDVFPHVKIGVKAIIEHPYFLLADDMGGSKTAQTIIAAQFLHEADVIDRVIVVAPAAVRPKVWYDEDLGQLREQVWDDKRNKVTEYHQRIRSWEHGPKDAKELRWIVTNFEFIRSETKLAVLLPYCTERTLLVLDESSAARTWNSQQTKACMKLRWKTSKRGTPVPGVARCGRILLLNGTPVAESPLDMFAQANLMHPSILDCRFVTLFKARYAVQTPVLERGKPMMRYGKVVQDVASWTNLEDLQRRLAPYVLRREAKALGIDFALPPIGLEVTLTPKTWAAYREMRDELVVWLKSGVATAATAAVKGMRLAQITSGFVGGVEESGIVNDMQLDDAAIPCELQDMIVAMDDRPWTHDDLAKQPAVASALMEKNVVEVGREKLDFALEWQAELLRQNPNLKLLTWCRFVPELRRYVAEVSRKFQHPVGAASGSSIFGKPVKQEREIALRLLHPRTAPSGPVTVGATQGTGALGLNFTACRTVLDMSYDFSPWKKKQGDSRVNRPGQTGPVSFFYLIAVGPRGQRTIDFHIMMTRLGKANLNDWTVSAWVKALEDE